MTIFEYVSVFISIVLALGVVHVLTGAVRLFGDEKARPYWVHSLWTLNLLVFLAFFWWFSFDWRLQEVWTFPLFLFVVGFAMLLYVLCVVLVPINPPDAFDYREFFFGKHRQIFLLWGTVWVVDILDTVLKGSDNLERMGGSSVLYVMTGVTLAHFAAALTSHRRVHEVWAVIFTLLLIRNILTIADVFHS
jgi:hypothetical protein